MTPHGVTPTTDGIEVSIPAPQAEAVEICLFVDGHERRHLLSAGANGTHTARLAGVAPGSRYGLRAHGAWDPARGLRTHPSRLLLDPYARAVTGRFTDHPSLHDHHLPSTDTAPHVPRGVVVAPPEPPRPGPDVAWSDTVIYETHVRGMTMLHPHVPEDLRGTYLGLASDPVVDHLLGLGVTTVELMPVAHFVSEPFLQRRDMANYWGYSTLAWFAPHAGYATVDDGGQVEEFASMVDRLHAAGLEVLIDVVFNHTAEGDADGPVLSMKGLDNGGWYRLDPDDPGRYVDWTGTGNTLDTGSPAVRQAILDALRWWAVGLGVDGFRFDLAVALGRREGPFEPGSLGWITDDPVVGRRKLVGEPWDLGPDGYAVGRFGEGWAEWNGRFRDDVRDVWRGQGTRRALSVRVGGSPDLYGRRGPRASIDFITAHDGFTLADLVAYDHKHNDLNGEDNRDGHHDNRSWNSGVEGPTDDPGVRATRRRRAAAMLATLLLTDGVPMLLGGDELGRSQQGNNNAYAVDGPLTWFDWSDPAQVDVVKAFTDLRRRRGSGRWSHQGRWRAPDGGEVDWDRPGPVLAESAGPTPLALALNPTSHATTFSLSSGTWARALSSDEPRWAVVESPELVVPPWTVVALAGPDHDDSTT